MRHPAAVQRAAQACQHRRRLSARPRGRPGADRGGRLRRDPHPATHNVTTVEHSMVAQIRVPQMGESVTEGVVGPWLKKEGDPVSPDEPVVTLETEKVAVDVVPEEAGLLERILQPEGASVKPGDVLATVAPLAAPSVAGTPARQARPGTAEEGPGAATPPATRAAVEVPAQGAPSNGALTPA